MRTTLEKIYLYLLRLPMPSRFAQDCPGLSTKCPIHPGNTSDPENWSSGTPNPSGVRESYTEDITTFIFHSFKHSCKLDHHLLKGQSEKPLKTAPHFSTGSRCHTSNDSCITSPLNCLLGGGGGHMVQWLQAKPFKYVSQI